MQKPSVEPNAVGKALSWLLRDAETHDRLPILFLVLVVVGFFLPSLVRPGVLIWPNSGFSSDIIHSHWPEIIGYAKSWRSGHIMLWDPATALGRPLAGNPGVMFLYPFDLLFLFVSPALAFNILNSAHVFFGGSFTFLLLRVGYRTSRLAALVGGLAFALMPKLIAHLAGGHLGVVWAVVWLPAVLLGLKLACDGSLLAAALAGLATALPMPNFIQVSYYTAAIASAFWLWEIVPVVWTNLPGKQMNWSRVGWLLAIYAVWLLTFVLLSSVVLPPFLEVLPYNSRGNFTLDDANLYALPPFMLLTLLVPTNFQFPEWTMFVGLVPLLLASAGMVFSRQTPRWFFGLLAVFALVYSLGASTPLFKLTFDFIPGFRLLRVPTRMWFFGGFAVSMLAGFGADLVANGALQNVAKRRWRLLAGAAGLYLTGGMVALIGYWTIFHRWHVPTAMRLMVALIVVVLATGWLTKRVSEQALQYLLIFGLLIDLVPVSANYIALINPRDTFLRSTPALDFVAAQPGIFRVYSPGGDMPYAVAAERGVESLDGLLSFQLEYAVQAIRLATGCQKTGYSTAVPPCLYDRVPGAVPDAMRLGRLNVRYVMSKHALSDPNFKLVMEGSPAVYENLQWLPRTRVVPRGNASIVERHPGDYRIVAMMDGTGQLILSEAWAPGWQVTIDGQLHHVDRVEDALLGVKVESGRHEVHFFYAPLGWRIGWPISLVSFIGLAVWTVLAVSRRTAWLRSVGY